MSAFRQNDPNVKVEDVNRFSAHDEFLFGLSVAMNGNDLARAIEENRAGWLRSGRRFRGDKPI